MASITIEWIGLEGAISRFSKMGTQLTNNIENQVVELKKAAEDDWREGTPVRSGRLAGADKGYPAGMSITFVNPTYYYKFVDLGHRTPSYFRRHGRIIPAKRVSHVEGRLMTERLVEFLEGNVGEYLKKAIDELGD